MSKYKIGDIVRIKPLSWYEQNCNEDGDIYTSEKYYFRGSDMKCLCGATAKIINIEYGAYILNIGSSFLRYHDFMLEPGSITKQRKEKLEKLYKKPKSKKKRN